MTDKLHRFKNIARTIELTADEKQALFQGLFTSGPAASPTHKRRLPLVDFDWGKLVSMRKTSLAAFLFDQFGSSGQP